MKIDLVVMYKRVRTGCILRTTTYREKRHIAQKERCMERSCSSFFKKSYLAREQRCSIRTI